MDPDGEFAFVAAAAIGAAVAGASYSAKVAVDGSAWHLDRFAVAVGIGAISGAIAGPIGSWQEGLAAVGSSIMPSKEFEVAGVNLSVGPSVFYGSHGWGLSGSVSASAAVGSVRIGGGYAYGLTKNSALSYRGSAQRFSYGGSYKSLSYYRTHYGAPRQIVGSVGIRSGGFYFRTDNDVIILGGNGDRFRTAALEAGYGEVGAGFQLVTGDPEVDGVRPSDPLGDGSGRRVYRFGNDHRMGAVYASYRRRGQLYRAGVDSETARAAIQNNFHDIMNWTGVFKSKSHHFRNLGYAPTGYYYQGMQNLYSIY